MKRSFIASLISFLVLNSTISLAETCTYSFDPSQAKITWTAFKTTAKVPVSGSFKAVVFKGNTQGDSVEKILSELKVQIDAGSVDSANAGRDLNIVNGFFKHFKKGMQVSGLFKNIKGYAKEGAFDMALAMNGKVLMVPMTYSATDAHFTAKGAFDLKTLKLDGALSELNKICLDLHKGTDGVTKTWSEILLSVETPVQKKCL